MTSQSFQLVMRSGPTPGKVFELSKSELYVGRDIANDVSVNDSEISRRHARFTLQGGTYVLEDLGSTNGTFVDGQRLMGPHVLRPGELIMFGENVGLVFEAAQFDINATIVAAGQAVPAPMPVSAPAVTHPPQAQAFTPQPPVYAQQVPVNPPEYYARPAPQKKGGCGKWILAGCGCIVVVLCLVVVGIGIWYAASPSGFEKAITDTICSGDLKSTTEQVLKEISNIVGSTYTCP
jgi:hypothetical protein